MPVLDRFSLSGKTAVVTGGAGNYGRQIVAALAEAGAETYVASRNLAALETLAAEHRSAGRNVTALQYDQGEEASILRLHDEVLKRSGKADILINNSMQRTMLKGYADSPAAFTESMRINATGIFTISRAFGDSMARRGQGGSIVNVASIHGIIGPDHFLYDDTSMPFPNPDYFFHKGGLINYTRYLASYYGRAGGIRCNAISPGGYGDKGDPEHLQHYRLRTFLGRRADDTDLMGVVVFLASDASLYVTGANIVVDAGYTAM